MADEPAYAIFVGRGVTSSVPTLVAWVVLGFCAVTSVFRLLWFSLGAQPSERLVTYALLLGTISGVLRERVVQDWLAQAGVSDVPFTRQVSAGIMVIMFAPLVLLAASWWERTQVSAARLSQRVWLSAYLSAVVMLVLGARSRELGDYIDRTEGWPTVAYFAIFSTWCGAVGVLMVMPSVMELRAGHLRPLHRLTYVTILIVGIAALEEAVLIFVSSLCAANDVGSAYVEFRIRANEMNYTFILGAGALLAVAGVAAELLRRLHLDPASRAVRQLTPMWKELVAACPEIPRPATEEGVSPRRRMHRMTVEIRDALLVLGRYTDPAASHAAGADREAIQIAHALRRKQSGIAPGSYCRLLASTPGRDIVDETRALRRIARHWHEATLRARTHTLDGVETT